MTGSAETSPEITEGDQMSKIENVSSKEIERLETILSELQQKVEVVDKEISSEQAELTRLDNEYGSEIARVKKEFNRIKERAGEESREAFKNAKVDAIKAVLPITDNYLRAKQVYGSSLSEGEEKIMTVYNGIFDQFNSVLAEFGATRIVSVGQPFDFNMMEAIMMVPSNEYAKDIVSTEYQIGYKLGDKCIRPAMVTVSAGPGPQ